MRMSDISKIATAFCANEEGVTSIEYALIAALIFIVIVASLGQVGNAVAALFVFIATAFP